MDAQSAVATNVAQYDALFRPLEYIKEPLQAVCYLAVAFALLGGLFIPHKGAKSAVLGAALLGSLGMTWWYIATTLQSVEAKSLVHIVRAQDRDTVELGPTTTVQLLDIETLKGEPKRPKAGKPKPEDPQEINNALPADLMPRILVRSGLKAPLGDARLLAKRLRDMDQHQWGAYLDNLGETRADLLKHWPFALIHVTHGGDFTEGWYVQGDEIRVPKGAPRLKLINVYNTRHYSSGEPEAVNLKVLK